MGEMGVLDPATISNLVPLFVVLGVIYLGISFFSTGVGLAILALSMMFSPEISVGTAQYHDISLRSEDFLIPILFLAWIGRAATRQQLSWFTKTPVNRPIGFLLILMIFSTARGAAVRWVLGYDWVFYLAKTVEFFAIFYLVINYTRSEKEVKQLFGFALLTLALLALYTLPQVRNVELFSANRITAPFEGNPEPATAGGYMAFFLVILFSMFICMKRSLAQLGVAVLALCVFIPFIFTLNRSSYAALFVGLFLVCLLSKKRVVQISLLFFDYMQNFSFSFDRIKNFKLRGIRKNHSAISNLPAAFGVKWRLI